MVQVRESTIERIETLLRTVATLAHSPVERRDEAQTLLNDLKEARGGYRKAESPTYGGK